jgi:hypothetical protein
MIIFLEMAFTGINVEKINNLNKFKRESSWYERRLCFGS